MEKEKIMKDLEESYEKMKQDLGLSMSLDELDYAFFVRDGVLQAGFVSEKLSRQLASRIKDTYMSWVNYLHMVIFPAPGNMLAGTESKAFDEPNRKEAWRLMTLAMEIASRNSLIGLSKDKKAEAEYFEDSYKVWKNEFEPKLIPILEKVNKAWKGEESRTPQ